MSTAPVPFDGIIDRDALLAHWQGHRSLTRRVIDSFWRQIPTEGFGETLTAFGQYKDTAWRLMLYVIDNEIHHRGQGYVYLRALGIEPPPFWERQ